MLGLIIGISIIVLVLLFFWIRMNFESFYKHMVDDKINHKFETDYRNKL